MTKTYRIGNLTFALECPDGTQLPPTLSGFEVASASPDHLFTVRFSDDISETEDQFRSLHLNAHEFTRQTLRVLADSDQECRIISFAGDSAPYAISCDANPSKTEIVFRQDITPLTNIETIFLSPMNLERYMYSKDYYVLHAAYIEHEGSAILFTAPSGIGKSTQAGLWETYRNSKTINGDKVLIHKDGSVWRACGWPICGSSGICVNESYPIRAIVYLSQAKENTVRSMTGAEAVKKLYSQMTVNMWNPSFQMRCMDMLLQLTAEIPVFSLECNISEDAVTCLEGVL